MGVQAQGKKEMKSLLTRQASLEMLQDRLYRARQLRLTLSRHHDHFPAAPQQMSQAALVQGLEKLPIDAPTIAHQKTVKIFPQHGGGLFEPAARLNRINGNRRGAEGPHPPQLSSHSPAGFIRSHTRTAANLFHQRLIARLGLLRYPRHGLAQPGATHLQSEGLPQHRRRLPVRQSQSFIELRGQRQRSGTQLRGRTAQRIRGLPGVSALPPAVGNLGNAPHECETQSAPPVVPESPSETGNRPRFPAARLRSVDSGPAAVLRQFRRLVRGWAGDSGAHTSFLLCVQVFGDGPSVLVVRKVLPGASQLAVLLPARAAGVRSLPSVPQSRAPAARSFRCSFLLPHRQTNRFSYEHNYILERHALTLNNYLARVYHARLI